MIQTQKKQLIAMIFLLLVDNSIYVYFLYTYIYYFQRRTLQMKIANQNVRHEYLDE